jgi:hypothetical protein
MKGEAASPDKTGNLVNFNTALHGVADRLSASPR